MNATSDSYGKRCTAIKSAFDSCATHRGDNAARRRELEDRRLTVWVAFAQLLLEDMSVLRPPAKITKPATIPESEMLVWDAIMRVKSRGARAPKEQIEIAEDFHDWRNAHIKYETRFRAQLQTIVEVVYQLRKINDDAVCGMADEFRRHALANFGVNVPPVIEDNALARAEQVAALSIDVDAMPHWMRAMTKPRGCYPSASDDDDREDA